MMMMMMMMMGGDGEFIADRAPAAAVVAGPKLVASDDNFKFVFKMATLVLARYNNAQYLKDFRDRLAPPLWDPKVVPPTPEKQREVLVTMLALLEKHAARYAELAGKRPAPACVMPCGLPGLPASKLTQALTPAAVVCCLLAGSTPLCGRCGLLTEGHDIHTCICERAISSSERDLLPDSLYTLATALP